MIKMRCWNGELKKWDECAYPIFNGLNPVEVIGFIDNHENEQLIENGSAVVLYTGFTDVDGKEIYEGDILRIYDEEDNEDFSWVDDVSFLCGGFFSGDEDLVGNIHFRARVIGNIYENLELLEDRAIFIKTNSPTKLKRSEINEKDTIRKQSH